MKKIMEEYTDIVNEYIYTENGKCFCTDPSRIFEELTSFWLCEYQSLVDKLQKENNELRTYHFCQTANDAQKIIERSSLLADKILIPDMTVLMGVGLNPENYQISYETSLGFLWVASELTDWINEGIVVIVPNLFNGTMNYSMDIKQKKQFIKHFSNPSNINSIFDLNDQGQYSDNLKTFLAKDILSSSGAYKAIPATNHPVAWEGIIKVLEEDEKKLGSDIVNIAAINSLNLNFLDNVPLDFMKDLRDKGYLAELRQYLKKKFRDIETSPNDSDFLDKIKDISIDINDEISIHEHEWDEIKKELKDTLIITGTASVVAGTVSTLVIGGTSVSSLLGVFGGSIPIASGARDIIRYLNNKRSLKKNGVHLLFELKKSQSF